MSYAEFPTQKTHEGADSGFEPLWLPDELFDFQREMVTWALRKGRAALFEDCGMGKTFQFLVWAANVAEKTGERVLILSPLAVAPQTVREANKFGIELEHSSDGDYSGQLVITNYERLHMFDPADFAGVVCDESSILKSFDGARKTEITSFMRKTPYRLLCTATAAPNDYHELGTSSEALGYMGYTDMLHRFFINDQNNNNGRRMYGEQPKWRFKGHAELSFWQWVSGWARAIRKPSDLGFDDSSLELPKLTVKVHHAGGMDLDEERLFTVPARTLAEQRKEKRKTLEHRCEMVADLVNDTGEPALVWCQLNDEADLLEKMIPDAVQVSGSDSDEAKESKFLGFINGTYRVLVTKPRIGAWGLNFQHCRHVTYFPSHSYEQYYQAIRRCWRFGQEREVKVDVVLSEGEQRIFDNLSRKAEQAETMFDNLVEQMNDAISIGHRERGTMELEKPSWL
jgi:hypothetical protein